MKSTRRIFGLLVAVAMIPAFLSGCSKTSPTDLALKVPGNCKWEYAELGKSLGGQNRYWWEGPGDDRAKGKSHIGLAKNMNLTIKHEDSTALLNALGEQGWELVNHSSYGIGGGINGFTVFRDVWTFRRRK